MKLSRLLLTGLALAFLTLSARADVAFFPWPRTDLDIRVRFENLNDHPAYDFYLKYALGRGNPSASFRLTKLRTGVLTRLEGGGDRFIGLILVAVPRGQEVEVPKWREWSIQRRREWYDNAPTGGLQCELKAASGQRVSGNDHNSEFTYRVTIVGNQLAADCIESKNPTLRMWLAIAGVGLSAVALAGVFVIRWRRRARQSKSTS